MVLVAAGLFGAWKYSINPIVYVPIVQPHPSIQFRWKLRGCRGSAPREHRSPNAPGCGLDELLCQNQLARAALASTAAGGGRASALASWLTTRSAAAARPTYDEVVARVQASKACATGTSMDTSSNAVGP